MLLNELEKSILKTVCFFDVIDYPLTTWEIWRWLEIKIDFSAVSAALAGENLRRLLGFDSGFYFLNGRADLAGQRLSRYAWSENKFKKALAVIKILRYFPWVRGIAVYGSLALSNPRTDGDIDLFVISRAGRLWSCRFFINLFLKVFHLRPTKHSKKNKICVSYLAGEDGLDLSVVNESEEDYYYYYGAATFLFLYERDKAREKFFAANSWVNNLLPNSFPYSAGYRRRAEDKKFAGWAEKLFFFLPEKFFQKIQWAILPPRFKKLVGQGKKVIVSDKLIKLHDHDNHLAINSRFEDNFERILNHATQA